RRSPVVAYRRHQRRDLVGVGDGAHGARGADTGPPRAVSGPVLHRWHRRFGVAASLFLAWLALSGLLLNHSPLLGLDRARTHASWLLRLYGLESALPQTGWSAGGHWLVVTGEAVALDGRAV